LCGTRPAGSPIARPRPARPCWGIGDKAEHPDAFVSCSGSAGDPRALSNDQPVLLATNRPARSTPTAATNLGALPTVAARWADDPPRPHDHRRLRLPAQRPMLDVRVVDPGAEALQTRPRGRRGGVTCPPSGSESARTFVDAGGRGSCSACRVHHDGSCHKRASPVRVLTADARRYSVPAAPSRQLGVLANDPRFTAAPGCDRRLPR